MKDSDYDLIRNIVSRHSGLFDEDEINRIMTSEVAIAGLGSVGSCTAEFIVRMGVCNVKLSDLDIVDLTNLNRQILYDFLDLGQPKVYSALRKLRMINPFIRVEFCSRIDKRKIVKFIKGSNIVVDAVDDHLTKVLISRSARKLKIPVLHLNAFGFRMTATTFTHGGISYEELFDIPSKDMPIDLLNRHTFRSHVENVTRVLSKKMVPDQIISKLVEGRLAHPVFTSTSVFAGAIGATEVAKLLSGHEQDMVIAPRVFQFDLRTFRGGVFEFDAKRRPTCLYE